MDIEEFKLFLLNQKGIPENYLITIEPYIAIEKIDDVWFSFGFCYISSSLFRPTFVGGYKGKSETIIDIKKEQNTFTDLIHLHLTETFSDEKFKNHEIRFEFKTATQFEWNN